MVGRTVGVGKGIGVVEMLDYAKFAGLKQSFQPVYSSKLTVQRRQRLTYWKFLQRAQHSSVEDFLFRSGIQKQSSINLSIGSGITPVIPSFSLLQCSELNLTRLPLLRELLLGAARALEALPTSHAHGAGAQLSQHNSSAGAATAGVDANLQKGGHKQRLLQQAQLKGQLSRVAGNYKSLLACLLNQQSSGASGGSKKGYQEDLRLVAVQLDTIQARGRSGAGAGAGITGATGAGTGFAFHAPPAGSRSGLSAVSSAAGPGIVNELELEDDIQD